MRTVLITDGEQRAALAIVRSLGHAGYRCIVCGASGRTLAGASRFAAGEYSVPDPGAAPEKFVAAVRYIVSQEKVDLLIPVAEPAVLALLPERRNLAATIPFPSIEIFRAICDKKQVLEAAAEVGIRVPRQRVLSDPSEAASLELQQPLVLKPHASVVSDSSGGRVKLGVRWVRSRADLCSALGDFPEAAYPVLAQEAVEGPGIGVFVLVHEGAALASFAHRRLREKPPSGGVSVLRQSEPMNPALLERSLELLRKFAWDGVAMVEYKLDSQTGEAVLMEINGRFWGSLQLAVDAGIDFPQILAAISLGNSVAPAHDYSFVRSRWFWGDVDHLIACWRSPEAGLWDRVHALADWLRAFGPTSRAEVFRWRDLSPFIRESTSWLAALLR